MRVEVPECRRCCLCLPLRRGLLAWAYLYLVIQLLALGVSIRVIYIILKLIGYLPLSFIIITAIHMIMLSANSAYCILVIVAGHKKSWKLLRVSYKCGLVIWITSIIIFLGLLYFNINAFRLQLEMKMDYESDKDIILKWVGYLVIELLSFCLNGYIILLIRSEMLKLQEQSLEIEFVNNAERSQARCVRATDSAISRENSDSENV